MAKTSTLRVTDWATQNQFNTPTTGGSIVGGNLVLQASSAYPGANSLVNYDITGSSVSVELVSPPNAGNGSVQAALGVRFSAGDYAYFSWEGNSISPSYYAGGTGNWGTTTPYNAANHRYMRLREDAGTFYWDLSADAVTWTTIRTATIPWDLTNVTVYVNAGNWNAEPNPGAVTFGDINYAPEPEPEPESSLLTASTPPYSVTGLKPNTNYSIRMRSLNNSGISAWSSLVSFTTLGSAGPTPFVYGATGATNTTVRSTLSPSGGANTQTTDLTNINNAIQSASTAGGGIVRLNAGTYYINGAIIQRSNVTLEGASRPADSTTLPTTIIKNGPNAMQATINGGYSMHTCIDGSSNMTTKNILFDQSEDLFANNLSDNVRLSAYLCEFRGGTNVVFDGVFTRNPFTYNIVMADCIKLGVRNCNVLSTTQGRWNQIDGIHVFNSWEGDVVDNHVDNGAGGVTGDGDDGLVCRAAFGTVCHDIIYDNNWVRGGRHGDNLQLAGGSDDIYNIIIRRNHMIGTSNGRGIIFGYYSGTTSSIDNITIGGGPGMGNYFEDCPEHSVDLTMGPHTNCTVTYNTSIRSGAYIVGTGNGNVVSNNT